MKRALLFLLGVVLSYPAVAATKFVTQSGVATWANCGVLSAPCSMSTAQTNVAAGDTICASGPMTSGINTATAGSSGSRIVLDGSGEGLCIGATPASTGNTGSAFNFVTIDQPYWTVRGFTFGSMNNAADANSQVGITPGGDYALIEDNVFDGNNGTSASGYMGIIGNINNTTTDIPGVTIQDNEFRNFGQDAIRMVPRNATGGCTASIGNFVNLLVQRNRFKNVRTTVRTGAIYANESELTSCMDGRPVGFRYLSNWVNGTTQNGVNFDCQSTGECVVGWNTFRGNGLGVSDTYNVIQTGKADGGRIIFNRILGGVRDLGGAGDGSGIIADHAGTFRTLQTQDLFIGWNYVEGATSNTEACGIMVWSADNVLAVGNVLNGNHINLCVANSDSTGFKAYNNTMANPVTENVEYSVSAAASELKNNILYGGVNAVAIEAPSTAPTDGGNLMFGHTGAQVSGTFTPSSPIVADPQFSGGPRPTTDTGFRLKPTSPAIGAGVYVGKVYDYDGAKMPIPANIGAFGQHMAASRRTATMQ